MLGSDSHNTEERMPNLGMDEARLFVMVGEEATPVPMDEMLTLENLTEILGMTEEQLTQIVQQLLGETGQEITDVWSI